MLNAEVPFLHRGRLHIARHRMLVLRHDFLGIEVDAPGIQQGVEMGGLVRPHGAHGVRRVTLRRRAADRIRREEPLHAFHVGRGRAVALIHIAATNPLRSRRHSNLITSAVVT